MFSPWYKWARRAGGGDPENHVAINLALYGRGGKRWAMTERSKKHLVRDPSHLQIGPSALHWDGTTLTADIRERGAPWPSPLRGKIRVVPDGIATRETCLDGIGRHRWSPIAPSARVEIDMHDPKRRWQGSAYLDTNAGDAPLEEGFSGWHWSRAVHAKGVQVLYHGTRRDNETFCVALEYDKTGTARDFEPPPEVALPSSRWRVPRITRADSPPRIVQTLEDTPFYARSVLQIGNTTAVHESLSLDRFTAPWVQAMLPFKAPKMFFF